MDKKRELLKEMGIDFEDLGMTQEEFETISYEDFKAKIKPSDDGSDDEPKDAEDETKDKENQGDGEEDEDYGGCGTKKKKKKCALVGQFIENLKDALFSEKISDDWGGHPRYYYVDCDTDVNEVYCHDCEDWKLYGFNFAVNGDSITINWDSKTRKKFAIVDFEGEESEVFNLSELISEIRDDVVKVQSNIYAQQISDLKGEVSKLKEFKEKTLSNEREVKLCELWDKFSKLDNFPEYEALKKDCNDMSIKEIENSCYAILGRVAESEAFSLKEDKKANNTKQKVAHSKADVNEPYGGIFLKFGYGTDK